jgi:signal transduction histidine kinase
MRHSLAFKLILAFLAVALTTAALLAFFVRRSNAGELYRVVLEQQTGRMRQTLLSYYREKRTWDGIAAFVRSRDVSRAPARPGNTAPPPNVPPESQPDRSRFGVVDLDGRIWLPWGEQRIGSMFPRERLDEGDALIVDGNTVGYFFTVPIDVFSSPEASAYLSHTDNALIRAALAASAIALLLGIVLTRGLTRPIRTLITATQALAQGKHSQSIPVRSRDELGQLTQSFNQMSSNLTRAENARRQMTADVAHDLRTPLTVLGAYVEGMNEGVLQPTPERFAAMQTEVNHLSHLVDDLMTLARADAGEIRLNRQRTELSELLKRVLTTHTLPARERGVALSCHVAANTAALNLDVERMAQVLGNLVSNAIRHTAAGGCIDLSAACGDNGATLIRVKDTGEGIRPDALPFVFDRFYRGDAARMLNSGEAGLGLAIAKSLVEAHGGTISVESRIGVGSVFTIRFAAAARLPE